MLARLDSGIMAFAYKNSGSGFVASILVTSYQTPRRIAELQARSGVEIEQSELLLRLLSRLRRSRLHTSIQ